MMPTRIKRPRFFGRRTYASAVTRVDGPIVTLSAPCDPWLVAIDKLGDRVSEKRERGAKLFANIGDTLIVSTPPDGPIVAVVVVEACDGVRLVGRCMRGQLELGAVHVLPAWKAKPWPAKTRRRAVEAGDDTKRPSDEVLAWIKQQAVQ